MSKKIRKLKRGRKGDEGNFLTRSVSGSLPAVYSIWSVLSREKEHIVFLGAKRKYQRGEVKSSLVSLENKKRAEGRQGEGKSFGL
jgi:hypothetical protein